MEGFVHPYVVSASVEQTSVKLIVRDFDTRGLHEKERLLETLAHKAAARHRGARAECAVVEQYRNMKEVLDQRPEIAAYAEEAVSRAGLEVRRRSIRGGTDGSRLSFMGLPTPNIFAGEHNFHSRLEWVSVQDMEKAVEVIVHLARIWEERAA
jgi:tripeptide aminopeptidase